MAWDCGDHWRPTSLRPFASALAVGLPRIEQIVHNRKKMFFGRIPRLGKIVVEARLIDRSDSRFDIGVGCEENAPGLRAHLAGSGEDFTPRHSGHALIADQHRERISASFELVSGGQSFGARCRSHNRVPFPVSGPKVAAHRGEHRGIVIDDQKNGLGEAASRPAPAGEGLYHV
jgi:hypothetical protein